VIALHVVFKVAGVDYVIPAFSVLQLESFTGATAVPGVAAHVAGLVQLRGRVVPVIDLRVRFGLPPQAPTIDTRIVVVSQGERAVGLVADSAREVKMIAPEVFRPPPAVVAEQARGFVRAVAQVGGRLFLLLDPAHVIGEGRLE
jgi:purine-binding chemotaxis protein CheW